MTTLSSLSHLVIGGLVYLEVNLNLTCVAMPCIDAMHQEKAALPFAYQYQHILFILFSGGGRLQSDIGT